MKDVTVQEIAAALYTTPQRAVQQAKDWGDELHKLRGRLVSWASSYRLIERELTGRLDIDTPFDAARSNEITYRVIDALKRLEATRRVVNELRSKWYSEEGRASLALIAAELEKETAR